MVKREKSIVICIGTRPEIIKMAPVYLTLRDQGQPVTLVHSGQHDSMAWPLYEFFNIKPDVVVDLDRQDASLEHLSARLIERLATQWRELSPGAVLVHGDTSTASMAGLTAFYAKIPIGHVEAGLRTHERYDPFPEEMNRSVIARMAQWHFAPTSNAVENLANEGLRDQVHLVGNTAIDAARWGLEHLSLFWKQHPERFPQALSPLHNLGPEQKLLLITAHRRENWGRGIEQIAMAVRQWLQSHPEYIAVWPVHANREVADTVHRVFSDLDRDLADRVILTEPLDYPAMLWVMDRSWMILTDSGGIQEESAALDKPVLVLRDTTERPELVSSGRGILTGARRESILSEMQRLHHSPREHARMCAGANPFGDGRAAQRIASICAADRASELGLAA